MALLILNSVACLIFDARTCATTAWYYRPRPRHFFFLQDSLRVRSRCGTGIADEIRLQNFFFLGSRPCTTRRVVRTRQSFSNFTFVFRLRWQLARFGSERVGWWRRRRRHSTDRIIVMRFFATNIYFFFCGAGEKRERIGKMISIVSAGVVFRAKSATASAV